MQLIVGTILIILLSPIFLIASVIIYFDNGLPIFFKQKRIGKDNVEFHIYKFRTMKNEAPNVATHLLEDQNTYYTRVGPFLRKYSIDEIPQLLNVIKGDIAFIGPRPALYNQKDLITMRTNKGIHKLTPGITGWAQVNGRDELSIEKKVIYDDYYKDNKSTLLNVKILWLTFLKVLSAKDVSV